MKKVALAFAILFYLPLCAQNTAVLMVSFDGFRYDYAEKYDATNFKLMAEKGISTEKLIPSFPSKTFPNHYTLVTGLYPSHHNLVDNSFYDPVRKTVYRTRERDKVEDPYYYSGTPIWQVLRNNNLKSASYYWVGSEAPIQGFHPDYYHIYDGKVANEDRIKGVMKWFYLPEEERPVFTSLYFSLTDDAGHKFGPDSEEIKAAVKEADRLLGVIMAEIAKLPFPITLVVTSDHGMVKLEEDPSTKIPILPNLLDSTVNFVNLGTHFHLFESDKKKLRAHYKHLKKNRNHFKVYKQKCIPHHLHYKNNARIGDLFVMAEPGYEFSIRQVPENFIKVRGTHGYDPKKCPEMGAIFYAMGPNIKEGVKLKPFKNIDVFPFVLNVIGVPSPDIDGKLKPLKKGLKNVVNH